MSPPVVEATLCRQGVAIRGADTTHRRDEASILQTFAEGQRSILHATVVVVHPKRILHKAEARTRVALVETPGAVLSLSPPGALRPSSITTPTLDRANCYRRRSRIRDHPLDGSYDRLFFFWRGGPEIQSRSCTNSEKLQSEAGAFVGCADPPAALCFNRNAARGLSLLAPLRISKDRKTTSGDQAEN